MIGCNVWLWGYAIYIINLHITTISNLICFRVLLESCFVMLVLLPIHFPLVMMLNHIWMIYLFANHSQQSAAFLLCDSVITDFYCFLFDRIFANWVWETY